MPLTRSPGFRFTARPSRAFWCAAIGFTIACAAEPRSENGESLPRRHYRPGESIADARVCACEECVKRACCEADDEPLASATELGLTVPTCGGCYRRVWTVRGGRTCEQSKPAECCDHG